ncbi:helix-turn-helix domain-containing protein [Glutamicibacter sp. NPDC087344]|uniref:helix-turn-helix domain-containing protein n=1 Tax=Glutamicibacter sp. NPDC087344 TaxID=3363994 RepID=UPI00381D80D9
MTGFHDLNLLRDYRSVITPEVSFAIIEMIGPDKIRRMFRANTDPVLTRRVHESISSLRSGAKIYADAQREPEAPARPPVTSCKSSEEWITAKEAAEILGKGPRMVSNYRAAGDITGRKKDGRTWEYDKASVEEFALQLQLKAA